MKQIKLVAFDMDGTLTRGMSWHAFHRVAGLKVSLDNSWREMYFDQKISYTQWVRRIEDQYRKSRKRKHDFLRAVGNPPFVSKAKELTSLLRTRYSLHLVTSSVDIYANKVAKILNISDVHVNHSFVFDSHDYFNNITYQAPEAQAKVIYLKKVCCEQNLIPAQIVFVGDSLGDLEAFRFTGRGILVGKGNEKLIKAAWKQVDSLKEIERILL